jgi:hypothetical protein
MVILKEWMFDLWVAIVIFVVVYNLWRIGSEVSK